MPRSNHNRDALRSWPIGARRRKRGHGRTEGDDDSSYREISTITTKSTPRPTFSGSIASAGRQPTPLAQFVVLILLVWSSSLPSSSLLVSAGGDAANPALFLPNFQHPDASQLLSLNGTVGTFRTNFCDASYRVLVSREIPLERALEGRSITTVLDQIDLVQYEYDADGHPVALNAEYPGILPLLLDALCDRAGCTWRQTYTVLANTELGPNETFTDLLRWTTEVYDLSASFWSRSIERLQSGTTFTEQWYDSSIIMVAPRLAPAMDSFDPWGWLAPFDTAVWVMILVTLVFSTVVHWCLEVFFVTNDDDVTAAATTTTPATGFFSSSNFPLGDDKNKSNGDAQKRWQSWEVLQPWETLWRLGTAFTGHFEFEPTTGPGYLFSFSVAFWALLMGAAYTANLASFLVIRNRPTLSIQTVSDAVRLNKRLCVWRSTEQDLAVSAAFPVYSQSGRIVRVDSERGVFEGLNEGLCDIAITELTTWEILQRDATVNGRCNLEWIGRAFRNIPASFGVKSDAGTFCTSLLRDVFNVHLLDMEANGVIQALWDQHIDQGATVDCLQSTASVTTPEDSQNSDSRRRRQLMQQNHPFGTQEKVTATSGVPSSSSTNPQTRFLKTSTQLTNSAASGGGAVATAETSGEVGEESTKLSLTNMGGIFLLHGILSLLAVFSAALSWAWKRGYLSSSFGNKVATGGTAEQSPSSPYLIETPAPKQHHYHDKHHIQRELQHQREFLSRATSKRETVANLYALRNEVNDRFNAVDEKLAALTRLETMEAMLTARLTRIEQSLGCPKTTTTATTNGEEEHVVAELEKDDGNSVDSKPEMCWKPPFFPE